MIYTVTENELFALTLCKQVLEHVRVDETGWHFEDWSKDSELIHAKMCNLLDITNKYKKDQSCSYYKD